jgi:hypothetical protein
MTSLSWLRRYVSPSNLSLLFFLFPSLFSPVRETAKAHSVFKKKKRYDQKKCLEPSLVAEREMEPSDLVRWLGRDSRSREPCCLFRCRLRRPFFGSLLPAGLHQRPGESVRLLYLQASNSELGWVQRESLWECRVAVGGTTVNIVEGAM